MDEKKKKNRSITNSYITTKKLLNSLNTLQFIQLSKIPIPFFPRSNFIYEIVDFTKIENGSQDVS